MSNEQPPDLNELPPPTDDFADEGGNAPDGPFALAVRKPSELAKVETQTDAFAAAAAREVEARIAAARRWPREIDVVQKRLLAECSRPGFASESRYARPVGGDCKTCDGKKKIDGKPCEPCLGTGKSHAHGFSIRFAEAAYQALGNIDVSATPIYSDGNVTMLRCQAVDLETNASWKVDVSISKTVERRKLRKGMRAIDTRTNSFGDQIYIVPAEPAEHEKDCGATASKKIRDLILRLLPADMKEACAVQVKATMADQFRKQSAVLVAKLSEGFGKLKPPVTKDQIAAYLGHPVEQLTEDEYFVLRAIYMGVSEGHTTWANLVAEKRGDVEQAPGELSTVDQLKADLAKRAADREAKKKAGGGAATTAPQGQQGAAPATGTTTTGDQPTPQPSASQATPAASTTSTGSQPSRDPGQDG